MLSAIQLNPGDRIGNRYLVTGPSLHQGTMSAVYPVVQIGWPTQSYVAKIAVNQQSGLDDAELVAQFDREDKHLQLVKGTTGFPQLVESFVWNNRPVIITEYIDAKPLAIGHFPTGTREGVFACLKSMVVVASLLKVLHDLGLVHSDLKPDNLMIDKTGFVYLVDLGAATELPVDPTEPWGAPGPGIGSQGWAAPEIYLGRISKQSDFYALGAILAAHLTGKEPTIHFPYDESLNLLPGFPRVVQLVKHLTAHDPVDRPKTVEDVIKGLVYEIQRMQSVQKQTSPTTGSTHWRPVSLAGLREAASFATLGWGFLLGMLGVIVGTVGGAWWLGELREFSLPSRSSLIVALYTLFGFTVWLSSSLALCMHRSRILPAYSRSLTIAGLICCSAVSFLLLLGVGFCDWLQTRPDTISWGKHAEAFDPSKLLRIGKSRDNGWRVGEDDRRAVLQSLRLHTVNLAPSLPNSPLGYLGRHMRAFSLPKVKEPVLFFHTAGCLSQKQFRLFVRTDELTQAESLCLMITYNAAAAESETVENRLFFGFDPRKTNGPSLDAIRRLGEVVRALRPTDAQLLLELCQSRAAPGVKHGSKLEWELGTTYVKLFRTEKPADQAWILAMLEQLVVEVRIKARSPSD